MRRYEAEFVAGRRQDASRLSNSGIGDKARAAGKSVTSAGEEVLMEGTKTE